MSPRVLSVVPASDFNPSSILTDDRLLRMIKRTEKRSHRLNNMN